MADGHTIATWPTKAKVVTGLALSPEGSILYVAGDAAELEALGTADGKPMATWKNNKDSSVTDWKALVHHHWPVPPSEMVEKFTTTKPGARPFILK